VIVTPLGTAAIAGSTLITGAALGIVLTEAEADEARGVAAFLIVVVGIATIMLLTLEVCRALGWLAAAS
jgi:hypothetical protein